MSTNNARFDLARGQPEAWTFRGPWLRGQRCLVPADDYDEPYWGEGRNIWWRFARKDGAPWAIAGLWNEWADPSSGEVLGSYTMLTIGCNAHPLLSLMHKPDRDEAGQILPMTQQDKRTIVTLEREHWDQWLNGTPAQAASLMQMPALELFAHGAADPSKQVALPLAGASAAPYGRGS